MPQNAYVCSATYKGAVNLGVSPDCEMGFRVTNADPYGAISCAYGGHSRLRSRLLSGLRPVWAVETVFNVEFGIVREIRKHYVNVRFSEKESEKLNTQMHLSGYNNRSRYIRDALLSTRVRKRRNLSLNEANVAKQIELLRLDLKRIGVNYNQRVKTLNRLALVRDRHGNVIINARDIEHDMTEMKEMMTEMVRTFSVIREEVTGCAGEEGDEKESEDDESSYV